MESSIRSRNLEEIISRIETGWSLSDPDGPDALDAAFSVFPKALIPLLETGSRANTEAWSEELILWVADLPNGSEILEWMRDLGLEIPTSISGDLILYHIHVDPNASIVQILFGRDRKGTRWWKNVDYE